MTAHGLQRVAEAGRGVAVVDDERRAAMACDALREQARWAGRGATSKIAPTGASISMRPGNAIGTTTTKASRSSTIADHAHVPAVAVLAPVDGPAARRRIRSRWRSQGPSGTSSIWPCHVIGRVAAASFACCAPRSTGLVSTRCTDSAATKFRHAPSRRAARPPSGCRARARARSAAPRAARPSAATPPRPTRRSARRTSG